MAAGFLLEKEIRFIGGAVSNPAHPFAAIIGGAKVSDKIEVISNLLPKVDVMVIGGGMANTFLVAMGYGIGKSLVEADKIDLAKSLIQQAKEQGKQLLLPVDVVAAEAFAADAKHGYYRYGVAQRRLYRYAGNTYLGKDCLRYVYGYGYVCWWLAYHFYDGHKDFQDGIHQWLCGGFEFVHRYFYSDVPAPAGQYDSCRIWLHHGYRLG